MPKGRAPPTKWRQGLKSNFLVGKLNDILKQQPKGEGEAMGGRKDGAFCTLCEVGGMAKFYCFECTDYLCQPCNDAHSLVRVTRSHSVLDVEDLTPERLATELREKETSKCEAHNELNKFYCDTCHRVICLHCVVTAHKDHQYVEIEKAAERGRAKFKATLATVKNTSGLHEERIQQLRSKKDEWSLRVQRTEEQIEKQANTIIEVVKKVKNDRKAQLQAMNAAQEKQMDAAMEAAEMDLASSRSCAQFTDNVLDSLEYGSPAEVMSVVGKLGRRLEQAADDKITEMANVAEELDNLADNLTLAPPTGNKLELEVAKLMDGINQTTDTLMPGRSELAFCPRGVSLKLLHLAGSRQSSEEDGQFSWPGSIDVTTDGDIVVIDRSNERLQFLGVDGCFKKKVKLGFYPQRVAALKSGELLVTGGGHIIHVLDKQGMASRDIQVTGSTETGHDTKGIAVDGLGRIVVTIAHQVFVLSSSGAVILKFGENGKGQRQLSSMLYHVAVNSSNQIIISDWGNENVKIFDPTGRHLVTWSHSSETDQLNRLYLFSPASIITDKENNMILADSLNNRVSLFSPDGTFIRDVLAPREQGLYYPMGLVLTHDGHLIVSDHHSVKIFLFT